MALVHTLTTEQLYEQMHMWRGVEHPCKECGGAGTKAYGDTTQWRGGVGGQSITNGVCDKCWGSGEADITWPSHRKLESLERQISRLQQLIKEKDEALEPFASVAEDCNRLQFRDDSKVQVFVRDLRRAREAAAKK